jgi:hypothetical protein
MLVYVTNCWVGGWGGGWPSASLRAAGKNIQSALEQGFSKGRRLKFCMQTPLDSQMPIL